MIQLDLRSGVPICDQVVKGIIRMKAMGIISGGEQLPSVRALASRLSVNPNTIQKAYGILEAEGIVYSVKGVGSFLSDDERAHDTIIRHAKKEFSSAVDNAYRLGLTKEELLVAIEEKFHYKGGTQL